MKAAAEALDRVAAGLAAPFAGREIGALLRLGQAREADDAFHHPLARASAGATQHDRGDAPGAGGRRAGRGRRAPRPPSRPSAGCGGRRRPRCRRPARARSACRHGVRLGAGQPLRAVRAAARRARASRRFRGRGLGPGTMPIWARRASRRGLAEARTSLGRSTRGAGGYLKRNVIRPLVRS